MAAELARQVCSPSCDAVAVVGELVATMGASAAPFQGACSDVVVRTTAEGVGFEPTRTEWAPP
jgi:hypothetical protein